MINGETLLNHYQLFLGDYIGADRYSNDRFRLQLLGYRNVFPDSIVFASFGFSIYSNTIGNNCEVVLAVDDDYDECARIFANSLFYILNEHMEFGRGILIEGIDSISSDFINKHNKSALYFTSNCILPDEFTEITNDSKMYSAFFVSNSEAEYFKCNGTDMFEELLENRNTDIISINRSSCI